MHPLVALVLLAAPAHFSTELPGQVKLSQRLPGGKEREVSSREALSPGRYVAHYYPPQPARGACPFTVTLEAGGTVRADNHPELVQALLERYRTRLAPQVLAALHETCAPGETVELHARTWDGVFVDLQNPERTHVTPALPEPRYELRVNGVRRAYQPGKVFVVAAGQELVLAEASEPGAQARR